MSKIRRGGPCPVKPHLRVFRRARHIVHAALLRKKKAGPPAPPLECGGLPPLSLRRGSPRRPSSTLCIACNTVHVVPIAGLLFAKKKAGRNGPPHQPLSTYFRTQPCPGKIH